MTGIPHLLLVTLLSLCPGAARADAAPADATSRPTASAVLEASIEAMGGLETFARIREVRLERTTTAGEPATEIRTSQHALFPHTMRLHIGVGGEEIIYRYQGMRVAAGRAGQALAPADDETRDRLRDLYWREWWVVYARYSWHGLGEVWIEALEPQVVDGRLCDVVRLRPRDAGDYLLYVDRESRRPARRVFDSGDGEITDVFSDFVEHDGALFPFTVETYRDGQRVEVTSYASASLTLDKQPLTLARRLDAILTASLAEKRIPGLVAMVKQGDETVFEKAYGLESVELELPTRLDSVFPLASVSKTVAGTVAMRLVQRGDLDLDGSIADYLEIVPEGYRGITVRHLLGHSHGLADALSDNPGQGVPISEEERGTATTRLRWTFSQPVKFEPGHGWSYSVTGYEVLQAILETVSGLAYEALAAREIFEPLAMKSTSFGGSDRVVNGRLPVDYIWLGDRLSYNYLNYPREMYTGAGLNATARDVMTFVRAVADGTLLETETRDEMWREVILADGEPSYYALGWGSFATTRDGRHSVGHSGGGSSWTRYFLGDDLTVVVLSNLNGAREDKLVYDLATAVARADP